MIEPGASWSNPIWYRGWRIYLAEAALQQFPYFYVHDSYDGAPDASDNRHGYAATVAQCKTEIDDYENEQFEAGKGGLK